MVKKITECWRSNKKHKINFSEFLMHKIIYKPIKTKEKRENPRKIENQENKIWKNKNQMKKNKREFQKLFWDFLDKK